MTRHLVHAVLVLIGAIPWAVAMLLMLCVYGFAWLADRVLPDAKDGNCWSWALVKWARYGGYLLMRKSDGVPMILHVAWVHRIPMCAKCEGQPGLVMQQLVPRRRKRGWRGFADAWYFRGRVSHSEASRTSSWGDL